MTGTFAVVAAVLLLAGCASMSPRAVPPSYRTNPGQQCVKACWQDGFGCAGTPFDRCWYNDQCKARCDAVERDALAAQSK